MSNQLQAWIMNKWEIIFETRRKFMFIKYPKTINSLSFWIYLIVWDIFNSLRGRVFQKIKHYVFPVLVIFWFCVFIITESEFLKTKSCFCQGHIQKQKPLSIFTQILLSCIYRCHFDTYFSEVRHAKNCCAYGKSLLELIFQR